MKKLSSHTGERDKMVAQARQHLYNFSVNGCEQAKQRVLTLDKRLAHRGKLSVVGAKMEKKEQS